VIGHVQTGKLLAIKKVTNFRAVRSVQTQLKFTLESGDYLKAGFTVVDLRLYLICDSYVGADL
jgi:hypothetical protein